MKKNAFRNCQAVHSLISKPSAMAENNILLNNIDLLQHIGSICRKQRSGTLQLLQNNFLRKLLFHQGQCIAAMSTKTEELPGSFLLANGEVNQESYATYLEKSKLPDKGQWELATESLSLTNQELHTLKSNYVLFIIEHIIATQNHAVSFEAKTFSNASDVLCADIMIVHKFATGLTENSIYAIAPYLKLDQTPVQMTETFPLTIDDKTVNGLRKIIAQDSTVQSIFSKSLLQKRNIRQYLLTFSLLGWIRLEDASTFTRNAFIETLSEDQKFSRQQIIDHYHQFQNATYYQLFGMEVGMPTDFVQSKYSQLQSTLLRPDHEQLFSTDEENIAKTLQAIYQEAFDILTSDQKRSEYDAFLQTGRQHTFLNSSKTIAAEKAIAHFQQLCQQNKEAEAAAFGQQFLSKDKDSISFSIRFVEFLLTSALIHQQACQNIALELLKHHIQQHPDRYEPFFLLGKFCLLLQQPENAANAFMRALQIRPDLPFLRKYIIEKTPDDGPNIILQAISEKSQQMTYYQFLGVHPNASRKEIHTAYRLCCRHFHPDRFYGQKQSHLHALATQTFKIMAQAYRVLKKVQTRQAYDARISLKQEDLSSFAKNQPPTHFKAKQYYAQAMNAIHSKDFKAALVDLRFALQFEPDNVLLQKKIQWVEAEKKAH